MAAPPALAQSEKKIKWRQEKKNALQYTLACWFLQWTSFGSNSKTATCILPSC